MDSHLCSYFLGGGYAGIFYVSCRYKMLLHGMTWSWELSLKDREETKTNSMRSLLGHPSLTLIDALLQNTLLMASHVGRSSMFWSTSSSSSRFFSSPSPFRVLRLILSGDKFLVNLKENKSYIYSSVSVCTKSSQDRTLKWDGKTNPQRPQWWDLLYPYPLAFAVVLNSQSHSTLILSLQLRARTGVWFSLPVKLDGNAARIYRRFPGTLRPIPCHVLFTVGSVTEERQCCAINQGTRR